MENQAKNLAYVRAKNRVEKEKGFYTHLAIYIVVNLIITGFKVYGDLGSWEEFTNELTSIDVLSSWVVWGVFVILHFISFKYGQGWEERKIEQLMNKELSDNSKK